jgi:hypothetical protein
MVCRRTPPAVAILLAAVDSLPPSDRRKLLTALARRPGIGSLMAPIALARLSERETVDLWQKLTAKTTSRSSPLARIVRGTVVNYWRQQLLTGERERERLAKRPGPKRGDRTKALVRKVKVLLQEPKHSLAWVAQYVHATERDLLPASYRVAPVAHLSAKQKVDLGRYLHKLVRRAKKARSQGLF